MSAAEPTPTPFEQGQQAAAALRPLTDTQAARVAVLLSTVTPSTTREAGA